MRAVKSKETIVYCMLVNLHRLNRVNALSLATKVHKAGWILVFTLAGDTKLLLLLSYSDPVTRTALRKAQPRTPSGR